MGLNSSQKTHLRWPVDGSVITSTNGAQIHFSRLRCSDFSCLVQSYLLLKVSVQNVHWKIRRLLSLSSMLPIFVEVGFLLRRLRSRLAALPMEPNEVLEPCDQVDEREPLDKTD